jgi:hypothetical protein
LVPSSTKQNKTKQNTRSHHLLQTTSNSTTTTMAEHYGFTSDEIVINDNLGYPKAYAKLCRDRGFTPYSHGPPFTFLPYALPEDEVPHLFFLCFDIKN